MPDLLTSGVSRGLLWLARTAGGRVLTWGLAKALNRFVVDVVDAPHKVFAPNRPQEYRMIQLWLKNAMRSDAHRVKAELQWRRDGSGENVRTEPGIWFEVVAEGAANFSKGARQEAEFLGSGNVEHLGIAVKYFADREAYLLCPLGYFRWERERGRQDWRDPLFALQPGAYTVRITLRSAGGSRSYLMVRMVNDGANSILRCRVQAPRSIGEL